MTTGIENDLSALLNTYHPRTVLVIGTEISPAVAAYQGNHPECRLTHVTVQNLPREMNGPDHYDMGIIYNTLEYMDKAGAGQLIARLRDLHTTRFYAVLPINGQSQGQKTTWQTGDLIAYGMVLAGQYTDNGKQVHLYKFDINDYKKTPDWFNADHWANPELWDKYRW